MPEQFKTPTLDKNKKNAGLEQPLMYPKTKKPCKERNCYYEGCKLADGYIMPSLETQTKAALCEDCPTPSDCRRFGCQFIWSILNLNSSQNA